MRNREYRRTGRGIRHAVRDAVRYGNFDDIGRAVENGVQEVADNVNNALGGLNGSGGHPPYHRGPQAAPGTGDNSDTYDTPAYRDPDTGSVFRTRMPGRISGFVCSLLGFIIGVPLLISDVVILAVGAVGLLAGTGFIAATSILTPLTAAAFIVAGRGIALRRRAHRFERYRAALGGAAFSTVASLAESTGETTERAKKDLRLMIDTGACPQGHLDRTGTCFMVDDETYESYLDAEKSYEERARATQAEKQKEQIDPKEAELAAVEKEGVEYLQQIRAANDALPGKEISDRLDRLEEVTARIFACVKQHPEKLPEIRRFMRYYLPTTLKLVRSYQEFESQPVQGENITKAKEEISHGLDTVNTAFGNLLDTLFANDALDVSADISTLETMLKQEGLTGSDFEKPPTDGKDS